MSFVFPLSGELCRTVDIHSVIAVVVAAVVDMPFVVSPFRNVVLPLKFAVSLLLLLLLVCRFNFPLSGTFSCR